MTNASTLVNQPNVIELQPDRWAAFLAQFTEENRGAHARVEVLGPDVGDQVETEDRPFDGVSADTKSGERNVWITFGSTLEDHLAHGVHDVTMIRVLPADGKKGAVMEIEAKDGTRTILELSWPRRLQLPPGEGRRQ